MISGTEFYRSKARMSIRELSERSGVCAAVLVKLCGGEPPMNTMVRFRRWFVVIDGYIDHEIHARKEVLPELRKLKKYIREQELGEDDGGDVA